MDGTMNADPKPILLDRCAGVLLWLAATLPFILLAALAASLALAEPLRAGQAGCTGVDLLDTLAGENPAALAEVRRAARQTPNGKGLLWRIEVEGVAPSYLFGTMHMSDPRVTALPQAARAAFEGAEHIVIETTDILDRRAMAAALFKRPELSMFSGNETLVDHLSAEDRRIVEAALSGRGVPFASVRRMKPWMLISLVALPACEVARKEAGLPVLDLKLAQDAQAAGKELSGLESAVEQLAAMASLPMELHIRGLVETLSLGDRLDDIMETLVRLYLDGETGMFWPLLRTVFADGPGSESDYAAFEEAMVGARNGIMAQRAGPIVDRGGAFIAVGALHLPGENGVIELLRRAGYAVTRVD